MCQQYHLLAKPSTVRSSGQRQRGWQPLGGQFSAPGGLLCPGQPTASAGEQTPVSASQARNASSYSYPTRLSMFRLSVRFHRSWGLGGLQITPLNGEEMPDRRSAQLPRDTRADTNSGPHAGMRHNPFSASRERRALCVVPFGRSCPPLIQDKHAKQLRSFLWNEITEQRKHVQNPSRN